MRVRVAVRCAVAILSVGLVLQSGHQPAQIRLSAPLRARAVSLPVETVSGAHRAAPRADGSTKPQSAAQRAAVLRARAELVARWSSVMTCESDPSVEVPPGSGRWRSDSDAYPDALGIRAAVWTWAGGPTYVLGPHRHPASPWIQVKVARNLQAMLGVPGVVADQPCGRGYGVG